MLPVEFPPTSHKVWSHARRKVRLKGGRRLRLRPVTLDHPFERRHVAEGCLEKIVSESALPGVVEERLEPGSKWQRGVGLGRSGVLSLGVCGVRRDGEKGGKQEYECHIEGGRLARLYPSADLDCSLSLMASGGTATERVDLLTLVQIDFQSRHYGHGTSVTIVAPR